MEFLFVGGATWALIKFLMWFGGYTGDEDESTDHPAEH